MQREGAGGIARVERSRGAPTAKVEAPGEGLSVVVAYKIGKAAIELCAALLLVLAAWGGLQAPATALAADVERHALHGLGGALAHLLRTAARPGHLHLVAFALAADGILSALEGYLLWRRFAWARWVVVLGTGAPLPFELVRLVRRPSVVSLLLLLVNVAILAYVVRLPAGLPPGAPRAPAPPAPPRRVRARRGLHVAAAGLGALAIWGFSAYVLVPEIERHAAIARGIAPVAKRTSDASGIPADPLNVGFVGPRAELERALRRAGWSPAAPTTIGSAAAIAEGVLLGRSDPTAPVSPLFFEGRREDLAFERQVGGSPRRRHHVRLWRQARPAGGGAGDLWLGAATFDEGLRVSRRTGQITHRISPEIDQERDTLVADVARGGCAEAVHEVAGIGADAGARTTDGRLIVTDGEIAVVELACQ